jgi:hypothetical protein
MGRVPGKQDERRLLAQGYCALNETKMHAAGLQGGLDYLMGQDSYELIVKAIVTDPFYFGNFFLVCVYMCL